MSKKTRARHRARHASERGPPVDPPVVDVAIGEEHRENTGGAGNLKPPWKAGCASPNPGGRPSGSSPMAIMRSLFARTDIGGHPLPGGKTAAEIAAEVALRKYINGDVRWATLVSRYTEQPPSREIVIATAPDEPTALADDVVLKILTLANEEPED